MYAINIVKNGDKYEAWIYKFSIFTPTMMIASGDFGLEDAECYNYISIDC